MYHLKHILEFLEESSVDGVCFLLEIVKPFHYFVKPAVVVHELVLVEHDCAYHDEEQDGGTVCVHLDKAVQTLDLVPQSWCYLAPDEAENCLEVGT